MIGVVTLLRDRGTIITIINTLIFWGTNILIPCISIPTLMILALKMIK